MSLFLDRFERLLLRPLFDFTMDDWIDENDGSLYSNLNGGTLNLSECNSINFPSYI
jgi:hypothetical protein